MRKGVDKVSIKIFIDCRTHGRTVTVDAKEDVIEMLKNEIDDEFVEIRQLGVAGVDQTKCSIGVSQGYKAAIQGEFSQLGIGFVQFCFRNVDSVQNIRHSVLLSW